MTATVLPTLPQGFQAVGGLRKEPLPVCCPGLPLGSQSKRMWGDPQNGHKSAQDAFTETHSDFEQQEGRGTSPGKALMAEHQQILLLGRKAGCLLTTTAHCTCWPGLHPCQRALGISVPMLCPLNSSILTYHAKFLPSEDSASLTCPQFWLPKPAASALAHDSWLCPWCWHSHASHSLAHNFFQRQPLKELSSSGGLVTSDSEPLGAK